MYEYRISYGNGQVHHCLNYRDAERELLSLQSQPHAAAARIHRYEGAGDWVSIARLIDGKVKRLPPKLVLF